MRSVAFLRGINVGGHRVTSDELVAVFTDLGYTDVATFLASGNVLFTPVDSLPPDAEAMAEALESALGYQVPTTIRTGAELVGINDQQPFDDASLAASDGKPQVMLLFEAAKTKAQREVLALAGDDDLLVFADQELHWLPSGGMSTSDLDLKAITKLIGTNTIRTATPFRGWWPSCRGFR